MKRPSVRAAWVVSAAVWLAGCGAPRLFYDRLDWLASWQVGRYATLDAEQRRRFDSGFDEVWSWHRDTELPRYARDLRALALATETPLSTTQIRDWSGLIDTHWNDVVTKLAPKACAEMATFEDAQVASTLARVDRNIAADTAEFSAAQEPSVRADRARRFIRTLEGWIGDLEAAQRSRIERWNARQALTYGAWLDERRLWRGRLSRALSARDSSRFCGNLTVLFSRPGAATGGALPTRFDLDRAGWTALLADLSTTLSDDQRHHLRAELEELGAELEALATVRSSTAQPLSDADSGGTVRKSAGVGARSSSSAPPFARRMRSEAAWSWMRSALEGAPARKSGP